MDDKQLAQSLAAEGDILLSLDKDAYAERKYGEALVKDPTNVTALCGLGQALAAQGKVAEAIQQWQRGLALHPKIESFHFLLTNSYLNQRKLKEARQYSDEWLQRFPNSGRAHRLRSKILDAQAVSLRQKRLNKKEIIFHAQEAKRLAPHDAANAAHLADMLWEHQKNKQAANETFLHALRLGPENPWVHNIYGVFLFNTGDVETALQEFKHAFRLSPDDRSYANNIRLAVIQNHPLLHWTHAVKKRFFDNPVVIGFATCLLLLAAVFSSLSVMATEHSTKITDLVVFVGGFFVVYLGILLLFSVIPFTLYRKYVFRLLSFAFKKSWIQ